MSKRLWVLKIWVKVIFFIYGLLLSSLLYASEMNGIVEKIREADEIKSTDFSKFNSILNELHAQAERMTPDQIEFLSYLTAYQFVYARDHKVEGINKLKELANSARSRVIRFKATGLLISMFVLTRNYPEAFLYADQLNQLMDDISDVDVRSHGQGVLALLYNQINQYEVGLHYANQMLKSAVSNRYICAGIQLKLEALIRTQKNDDFSQLYDMGVVKCNDAQQPVYSNIIRSYKIESLINHDPAQAIELLNLYYNEVLSTSYKILITSFEAFYSAAYLKQEKVEIAEEFGLRALDRISPDDVSPAVILVYESLYQLNKSRGDHAKALSFFEKLMVKKKLYEDEKTAGMLAYNLAKAQVEVKNQRIALLNKDNELLHLQKSVYEQEVENNRLIMILLTLVLLAASALAYKGLSGRKYFKMMAQFDQLTGISNRYHFNQMAEVALDYCEKNAKPAALILFDLDYFKTINDEFGHAAGDWALHQVVKICRNFMRNNDVFGRIGGEEFAVVLPGCHADKALLLADICRDAIAEIDSTPSGHSFTLSASFGVSSSDSSGFQLKQLLADADKAMYQAKGSGRDQVKAFGYD